LPTPRPCTERHLAALEDAPVSPRRVCRPAGSASASAPALFTYYESPIGVSDRMTDEQWQQMVEEGTNPPQPDWTNLFITP
jgi:hypothetical protein